MIAQMVMPVSIHASNEFIETKIRLMLVDFFQCESESIRIAQLSDGVVNCYNNTDYQIVLGDKKYFAKHGNPHGKQLGTSLGNDIVCRTIASAYGLSPPVLLHDSEKTIMITEYVESLEDINLRNSASKKRYVDLLNRLHTSGAQFPHDFCPFGIIQQYLDHALEMGVHFPKAFFEEILPVINGFQKDKIFVDKAPCHLDPQPSNILDTGLDLYLIDWECAAMTDPLFDIACMCSIEEFSEDEMLEILTLYLMREPTVQDFRRFYQMRILADMRYCTYCYLQTKLSTTRRELFKTFAQGFLNRLLEHIYSSPANF